VLKDISITDTSGNPSVDSSLNGYNGFTLDTFPHQDPRGTTRSRLGHHAEERLHRGARRGR